MAALWNRHPRKIVGAGVALATLTFIDYVPFNPFYTKGVQNVETRWSKAGAGKTNTPAFAASRTKGDEVTGKDQESKAIGTPYYEENFANQRSEPKDFPTGGGFKRKWNEAQFGSEKGK